MRWANHFLRVTLLTASVLLGGLFFGQSRLIYFPQKSPASVVGRFLESGGKRIDYKTSQGKQTAWLQPPLSGGAPERFWIVCAGNASQGLSLDWLQQAADLSKDAFLLIDYPGYGVSAGEPSPANIRENIEAAVPLAATATEFPLSEMGARGMVFGHSLGAAAALIGAESFGIRRVLLLTPFTSTMDMAAVVVHLPVGFLTTHRFDNRARLHALAERGGHAWIFHGSADETIPVTMSRELTAGLGDAATYREIAGAGHNELFGMAGPEIFQAMRDARNGR